MKLKLYIYPHAPEHIHDQIPQYVNTVPFSKIGIAKHCEIVGPDEADYFYMGQYADTVLWQLHPGRFEFFKGREDRHIVDCEGDFRNKEIPEFLANSIVTAMDAYEKHRYWKLMVRPGMSYLLADLIKRSCEQAARDRTVYVARKKQFVFMGQRDSMGLRARMLEGLSLSGCPSVVRVNNSWGAQESTQSQFVGSYEDAMRESMFALCPCGEGIGVRFLEACYFGAIPILIDDHVPFCFNDMKIPQWYFQINGGATPEYMAQAFNAIFSMDNDTLANVGFRAAMYFDRYVRPYLEDPTAYFLDWAKVRGLIPSAA